MGILFGNINNIKKVDNILEKYILVGIKFKKNTNCIIHFLKNLEFHHELNI